MFRNVIYFIVIRQARQFTPDFAYCSVFKDAVGKDDISTRKRLCDGPVFTILSKQDNHDKKSYITSFCQMHGDSLCTYSIPVDSLRAVTSLGSNQYYGKNVQSSISTVRPIRPLCQHLRHVVDHYPDIVG